MRKVIFFAALLFSMSWANANENKELNLFSMDSFLLGITCGDVADDYADKVHTQTNSRQKAYRAWHFAYTTCVMANAER